MLSIYDVKSEQYDQYYPYPYNNTSSSRAAACHLHGDNDCGKVPKLGRDGLFYDGRITCATCATTFCRNGLWKKFGERVEGNMCSIWMCRLCLSTCCCRSTEECDVVVPDHVQHTHCHNFRCAYSQRKKRRMKREIEPSTTDNENSPPFSRTSPIIVINPKQSLSHVLNSPDECVLGAVQRILNTVKEDGSGELLNIIQDMHRNNGNGWKTKYSEHRLTPDVMMVAEDTSMMQLFDLFSKRKSS